MSGWSLRLARPEDAASMPAIERAAAIAFAGEPGIDPARTRSQDDFARLIRKGHSLVAHVGETMAGFLVAEPFRRELHIWEMDVAPAYQRRGIGAGLVRAAMIDAICARTQGQPIQSIGHILLLFRRNPKKPRVAFS